MAQVIGYHTHAEGGMIGHLQDILLDDADRAIRYLIVDIRTS